MTNVHSAVWLWNIGTVEPIWNSREWSSNRYHYSWENIHSSLGLEIRQSPLCSRDRHYLGSHIVDPFPRTPKPHKLGKIRSQPLALEPLGKQCELWLVDGYCNGVCIQILLTFWNLLECEVTQCLCQNFLLSRYGTVWNILPNDLQ